MTVYLYNIYSIIFTSEDSYRKSVSQKSINIENQDQTGKVWYWLELSVNLSIFEITHGDKHFRINYVHLESSKMIQGRNARGCTHPCRGVRYINCAVVRPQTVCDYLIIIWHGKDVLNQTWCNIHEARTAIIQIVTNLHISIEIYTEIQPRLYLFLFFYSFTNNMRFNFTKV